MFREKFKIIITTFLLYMCLFFAPSWLHGAESIDREIYKDKRIIIKKVTNEKELDKFGKNESADDHRESLCYHLDSPFGVYIAYNINDGQPVGLKSFSHGFNKDGSSLVAYPAINIIESYQGKGYGTLLNMGTLSYISQFFNQKVKMNDENLIDLALSGMKSSTEWFFGENLAALKSALNGGYYIYAIDYYGTLDMRYPNDGTLWESRRVEAIIEFSKIMTNPSSDLVEKAVGHMEEILYSLNYTKYSDLTTLLSVAERVIKIEKPDSFEGPDYKISCERKEIYKAIYNKLLCNVFENLSGDTLNQILNFVAKGYPPCHNFKGVLQHFGYKTTESKY